MASYSKITLIGNVGADPEVKNLGDKKVANFNMAITDSYTDKSGQRQEKTEWFRVAFWGQKSDVVEKFIKKGSQVHVEGKLSVRTYTDKEGKDRYSLEVLGADITLLGAKPEGSNNGAASKPAAKQPATADADWNPNKENADDLPF